MPISNDELARGLALQSIPMPQVRSDDPRGLRVTTGGLVVSGGNLEMDENYRSVTGYTPSGRMQVERAYSGGANSEFQGYRVTLINQFDVQVTMEVRPNGEASVLLPSRYNTHHGFIDSNTNSGMLPEVQELTRTLETILDGTRPGDHTSNTGFQTVYNRAVDIALPFAIDASPELRQAFPPYVETLDSATRALDARLPGGTRGRGQVPG